MGAGAKEAAERKAMALHDKPPRKSLFWSCWSKPEPEPIVTKMFAIEEPPAATPVDEDEPETPPAEERREAAPAAAAAPRADTPCGAAADQPCNDFLPGMLPHQHSLLCSFAERPSNHARWPWGFATAFETMTPACQRCKSYGLRDDDASMPTLQKPRPSRR